MIVALPGLFSYLFFKSIGGYPGKATITKDTPPKAPKEGETNKDNINATYEITDAQTKKNCNREPPCNGQ